MKKILTIFLTAILVLTACNALAASKWTENPKHIDGTNSFSSATFIANTDYAKVLEVYDGRGGWYYIEAPTDGDYYFTATPYDGRSLELRIHNEKGEFLETLSFPLDKTTTASYKNVKANEKLIINVANPSSLRNYDYALIICFDGYHLNGKSMSVITEPTCDADGSKGYTCEYCETMIPVETIPATGHTGGKKEDLQPATCIATGIEGDLCITCGEVLSTATLPIVEHTAGKMDVVKPATCLESGISKQHCTVCNTTLATETPAALGHTPGVWVDEPAVTCTADGKRVQHCTACNAILQEETVPAHGHRPMDWQITREAGCLQTGLNQKLCSDCGIALETETLNATGHHYTEWEVISEFSTTSIGEKRRHCIGCGDTQHIYTETVFDLFGF